MRNKQGTHRAIVLLIKFSFFPSYLFKAIICGKQISPNNIKTFMRFGDDFLSEFGGVTTATPNRAYPDLY